MKKLFISLSILFFTALAGLAQMPQLTVDGKANNGVRLQALKIEVKVCGTVARTSWQMTFKNTTARILEGSLNFPLKDGLNVSRYALDINGKMREAVPVDRGKGTAVFETIERRRVDPGLLEKVDGNTFRTRIYPINPNSTRTVIIGYEEELALTQHNTLQYYLPLNLKDTVADFDLVINVIQNAERPVFDSALTENLSFTGSNNLYTASFSKKEYIPDHSLAFTIPKPVDAAEVMLQEFENNYCFLINTRLQPNEREKKLPTAVAVLWDASLSGNNRNTKKELFLLNEYFKKLNNVPVSLTTFNNKVSATKVYHVSNGNWVELRKAIEAVTYDGATNLGNLNLKNINADEFILVSDGHQTFGDKQMQLSNRPVYCISSAATADYSNLKFIALKSGGQLIDLQKDDSAAAFKKLTNEPFRFLGIKQNTFTKESYPSLPVAVSNNFAIAGMVQEGVEEIVLQFGYGNTVTLQKAIHINTATQLCEGFDITKVFAQKKIAELDIQYEKNKQEEERIGKKFGIVTRNTSLIVLETVNDYIQYEIEPPAELLSEYNRIIKQRSANIITKKEDDLKTSMDMMATLQNWYNTSYEQPKKVKHVKAPVINTVVTAPLNIPTGLTPTPTGNSKIIAGIITDEKGEPVPNASIKIKSTPRGVMANADGRYRITAREGDVLQYNAVGYNLVESKINTAETINPVLPKAAQTLEEVVVTGAGVRRTERTLSYSVSNVSADALVQKAEPEVLRGLEGKVAGVDIRTGESTPGAATHIQIRGNSSFSGDNQPLIIVDGVPYSSDQVGNTRGISDIDPNNIASMNILKGSSAGALYGSRASNGVIIITTKGYQVSTADNNKRTEIKDTIGTASFNYQTFDYLKELRLTARESRYAKYLSLRQYYISTPVYFFETGSYFLKTGDKENGLKILSNLAELENNSYELYKMLGYKLKEAGEAEGEISAFKKVLELRPLDPQSFRDCALAYEDNGQYQQALDMLYKGMTNSYSDEMSRMYNGIEEIFLTEINRLIALHRKQLKVSGIDSRLIKPMPSDIRVVMNWNMNNTDIDLWVTDPNGEKCYYSYNETTIGGRISDDFTQGFGPEQFLLKKGIKGKYTIQIDYFNDTQVTIAGPTTVMAEIYLHYGTPQEEKRIITLQMQKDKEGEVFIGEVEL